MQFLNDISKIEKIPSSVVIGKFDGMHLGHRKLIGRALDETGPGMQTVIFTFSSPPKVSDDENAPRNQLITAEERRTLANLTGADVLIEYPFNENTRRMSAEDFYENILKNALSAAVICAGPDCSFGYKRRGNLEFLKKMEASGGIRTVPVEKEQFKGDDISSTRIKEELASGNMEDVNAMLGYEYGFCSEVIHGKHLGHKLGFPTINQIPPNEKALPPFGVYAARVTILGKEYAGVANVGVKPSISGHNNVGVETHILDFDKNVYGVEADVRLLSFIRPETAFRDLDELSAQIGRDKQSVRNKGIRL